MLCDVKTFHIFGSKQSQPNSPLFLILICILFLHFLNLLMLSPWNNLLIRILLLLIAFLLLLALLLLQLLLFLGLLEGKEFLVLLLEVLLRIVEEFDVGLHSCHGGGGETHLTY